MKTPPEQMRKGFDSSLARALKTTKQTLFVDWSAHAPDQTPQIMLIPDHALIPLGEDSHVLPAETMLAEVMARLMPDQVEKVLEFAITVGLSQNDRLRPEFERLRELYEAKVKERYALRARKSEIASSRRRAAT